MNPKTQNNCCLQRKYREYPPASWPHAFSCANQCQNKYSKEGREDKCSSIIYIAESLILFNECNPDFLKWVENQPDIYNLGADEGQNKFQFVRNEKMHSFFAPLPDANNKRVTLSKETKKKLKNAFGNYTATYMHRISLITTLPYVAKDSLRKDKKIDFMDVISILSLVYGDSPEYGLKRQLLSSSCFARDEVLIGYEEDQENKKEQEEPIKDNEFEEESVLDFNTQKASSSPQHKRGKVLRNIEQLNLRSRVANSRPKRNLGGTVNIDANLKSLTQKDSTLIAYSRPRRIGAVGTVSTMQKAMGCRFESDQTIPETLTESVHFVVKVSTKKWNCLLQNTMNTIGALGHLPLLCSAKKNTVLTRALSSTRLTDTLTVNLLTISFALLSHGYSTAITRNGLNLDFSFLQKYASQYRLPMLVLLRMV
jgi:hypothetical protein